MSAPWISGAMVVGPLPADSAVHRYVSFVGWQDVGFRSKLAATKLTVKRSDMAEAITTTSNPFAALPVAAYQGEFCALPTSIPRSAPSPFVPHGHTIVWVNSAYPIICVVQSPYPA